MVPHLVTALTGPINELEQRVLDSMPAIERWFRLEWMEHTPPFYSAVDMRNAGFKLAPVATDLYPEGWQNLTPEMLPLAVQAAMAAIEKICPEARNLLLIPQNRATSTDYLASLAQLRRIFYMAGLNVRIGSIDPAIKKQTLFELPNGESIVLEPVIRGRRRLGLKDFDPCTILLNNDLSTGVPGILEELHEQYLLPPLQAGGSIRRKSKHFKCYEEVAKRLGKLLGVDPWLITPISARCGEPKPSEGGEMERLASQVDAVLAKVRRKYKEYGIKDKPFVVLKADMAGQGAGVVMLRDAKDLDVLQQKVRDLSCGADAAQSIPDILIQEGVPSCERLDDAVAEPVVVMMDRYVVGGFYHMHAQRDINANLDAPGLSLVPLAFEQSARLPQPGSKPGASVPNRFYMYGVVGRLAMLAASYELEATDPDAAHYE